MHTVLETPTFGADCRAVGLSEAEVKSIVDAIAADPLARDLIPGAGGGKSGGCRTVHYLGGGDVPVFLLALYAKNVRADLSATDRNRLRSLLGELAKAYRRGR